MAGLSVLDERVNSDFCVLIWSASTETENMKLLFEQCLNVKQVLILMIGPTNLASSEFQKMISMTTRQL